MYIYIYIQTAKQTHRSVNTLICMPVTSMAADLFEGWWGKSTLYVTVHGCISPTPLGPLILAKARTERVGTNKYWN